MKRREDGLVALPRLHDYVARFAGVTPLSEAMLFGDERWTYAELLTAVERLGVAMRGAGVGRGDRVAMLSTPRPEFWVTLLATLSIGAIWVGLNPKYRQSEIEYLLADAQPALLVLLAHHDGLDIDVLTGGAALAPGRVVRLDASQAAAANLSELVRLLPSRGAGQDRQTPDPGEPAILVYTSGSTGRPKGALISHHGLSLGSVVQARHFAVAVPRIVCNLPINHVGCVADICSTTLVRGGTIIFQESFDAGQMLAAVECGRATILGGVPTMFGALLAHPKFETVDLSSVELILWGGAAMPAHWVEQLRAVGARLKTAYGMTETSCHVTFTGEDASVDELTTTVGYPVDEIECRIVDPEHARAVGVGEPGELQFRGPTNFIGYFGRPAATAEAFTSDGWLKTGDLAVREAGGAIRLVGRLKEMIKSGGYNIYPREIEEALESHPAVALAAVVGVPDPVFQEVGAAFVVLGDGSASADELLAYLRTRLANFKIPKTLRLCRDVPMLPIGKIDKVALKAMAQTCGDKEG